MFVSRPAGLSNNSLELEMYNGLINSSTKKDGVEFDCRADLVLEIVLQFVLSVNNVAFYGLKLMKKGKGN